MIIIRWTSEFRITPFKISLENEKTIKTLLMFQKTEGNSATADQFLKIKLMAIVLAATMGRQGGYRK